MIDQYITRGCFKKSVENVEDDNFWYICPGCDKLDVFNWLETIPDNNFAGNMVEVRFKNTRKGYFINNTGLPLIKGDVVAVEGSPGHDIGIVSLTGELVALQMRRYNVSVANLKKVYRKAKPNDVEKWFQAIEKEPEMIRMARQIAANLELDMKISDVEFQGDKTKATFYYISDERVDFRQLIKEYADYFKVRIEMKQIGARQEAGKVGGIGTCGRELCCASWVSSFASVSTSAARYQELSLNPQKLAGQCGKLKCCLNYELKCYIDAQADFPDTSKPLETEQGKAYHTKTDVYRRIMWYSFEKDNENAVFIPLDVDLVKEIIRLNQQGMLVSDLASNSGIQIKEPVINYQNAVGEDSINRFEEKQRKKKKKSGKVNRETGGNRENGGNGGNRENRENRENGEQKEIRKPLGIIENKPHNDRNDNSRHPFNRNKKN
jgi:cell fate regulator YaaT (PSP1 superfamily)